MHELGIVVHISKTLEELAQENNITDIRRAVSYTHLTLPTT